ncbi:hypothetical protein CALCODRAFT_511401 [Calocera cornea HHB12733]|uniref:GATA-domain-containing protein n=1 Tax=Calocera cornea HHB12733 TaxID=1353952 RepID=A0A165DT30_9BASI|nr:hypothetical protein CALCODRAFT_511401 [Calocera cornea HHB12733]
MSAYPAVPFGMADLPQSQSQSEFQQQHPPPSASYASSTIHPSSLSASAPNAHDGTPRSGSSPGSAIAPATRESSQALGKDTPSSSRPPTGTSSAPSGPAQPSAPPAPSSSSSTTAANGKEKDSHAQAPSAPATAHIYDFTKRKGWSGLLLSQLSGTIQFVFSPRGNVVFVSGCVREYLGWEAEEVVERNLVHLLHGDDIQPFFAHIHHAISTRTELAAYTRFRAKDERTPLFEVRGHPYFVQQGPKDDAKDRTGTGAGAAVDPGGIAVGEAGAQVGVQPGQQGQGAGEYAGYQCFFAMARPYPSRPAALLDSFLDLKIENEHLRQRLSGLAAPSPTGTGSASLAASAQRQAYHTAFYLADPEGDSNNNPLKRDGAGFPSSSGSGALGSTDDPARKRAKRSGSQSLPSSSAAAAAATQPQKTYVCVMCGRTDSPEWRKGPLGAKTLCNACGLRWAKRNSKRKGEGAAAGAGAGDALMGLLPGVGDDMDGMVPSVVNPPPPHTPTGTGMFAPHGQGLGQGQGSVNMSAAASGGTVDG